MSPNRSKPFSPVKRIQAIANKRAVSVYNDENSHLRDVQVASNFLIGKPLSNRRRDAFAAARRKLEGIGGPDELTDRSSGTSSNDEGEGVILEAGGALEPVKSVSCLLELTSTILSAY